MTRQDRHAESSQRAGSIAWMTRNRITPNLLMLVLMVGGFMMALRIKQEVFPEFDLNMVTVQVVYPGSSPEEIEQGIILSIEESIRGLDGIKEITATAAEGMGMVIAEMEEGADTQRIYQDMKQEIDRIITFPEDAEEPEVSLLIRRREVLQIQIYGDVSEWVIRELAEQVRDRLLQDPLITQVDLLGARRYEVAVEIDQHVLRTYGLTLDEVAGRIRQTSIEIPGGSLETQGGDILLRVSERRDWARDFATIPLITTSEGAVLFLGDVAQIKDTFEEKDRYATYNGKRAIGLGVYRVGEQTPIGVSDAVRSAMSEISRDLPPGINWVINYDRSDIYRQRLELLLKNAFLGLTLVVVLLGLFMEFRLAFWVTMGIPISFLGCFLFLPIFDVTINMISMFAFIVALGIVVDDAIVVGENIYEYRQRGMSSIQAAISGAQDVLLPVTFSILTNIVAFLPLCFMPGVMGKIWRVIPFVVITVFSISWIEALLILPCHLAHGKQRSARVSLLGMLQSFFSNVLSWFIYKVYMPFLDICIRFRIITVAISLAVLIYILGYVASGRIGIILMPRVESDISFVTATLPFGSPISKAEEVCQKLVSTAEQTAKANGDKELVEGIFALIDENIIEVSVYLTDPDVRPISTTELTQLWRERLGPIPGLESLRFEADRGGPGGGAALTIELSHRDIDVLDRASEALADTLTDFSNVKDIDDGYTPGKRQLDYSLTEEGHSLGLTQQALARQLRNAFYGAEAVRQQRGRNEVRAKVRLPREQRVRQYDLEQLLIRTPQGTDVPLAQIAEVKPGRAYTAINRRNGRRTVTVTANVEPISQTSQVKTTLESEVLSQLTRSFPGLSYRWEGRQQDMMESTAVLFSGLFLSLFAIYALLAVPFASYYQPIIVMIAIPFGIVGAVLGHIIMGYSLSLMSMMGIVALCGVVVNDSLILIDYANRQRRKGASAFEAIHKAGGRRFRPILLTTLTTFGGLAPMIFETSRQARFMIPMAISLGFGILFATSITLVIIPCLYLITEDVRKVILWLPFRSHEPLVTQGHG
ncbi:MAG: efflux RND transporter permease subunit [Planctomycetes bacterium]|nr:efflux RND transporter permease subunit [Planctomycetota bacterium]MBL7142890.1 efflux RND transporter permease subunit [Phycisphaerae bacterium]